MINECEIYSPKLFGKGRHTHTLQISVVKLKIYTLHLTAAVSLTFSLSILLSTMSPRELQFLFSPPLLLVCGWLKVKR